MAKAPGKANRNGINLMELFEMFPDDATAERWFVESRWPDGIRCAFCEGDDIDTSGSHPTQPYRCRDCRRQFSVKVNSVMHGSKLGYRKWAIAIYLVSTSLKGVSSMKLHRDLGVTQKTAWHMLHRIREAYHMDAPVFEGPVEVDETYIGGRESNKHESQKLHAGRGAVGKTAVVGMKDRPTNQVNAKVVEKVNKQTLHGLVHQWTAAGATVYTDEASAYIGIRRVHEAVRHSVKEYVRGMASTNGMESFWSMLKRGYIGVYHKMSPKHLHRYVAEFEGRHNSRPLDTRVQMASVVRGAVGKRLRYVDLIGPAWTRNPAML